jgi:hypothetical protein
VGLQGKPYALAAQPQPAAADRSELVEPVKHGADGGADGFVGMHFAIFLTPDEADGKAATQLAASGLVVIGIADERVGETAEIEQAVPTG